MSVSESMRISRRARCAATSWPERRIHQGMTAEPAVEYMPAASLKRLQARLDGLDAEAAPLGTRRMSLAPESGREQPPRRSGPNAMAAIDGRVDCRDAVALGLIVAITGSNCARARGSPTTTRSRLPTARAPDEVIRAVFSPTITLVELQAILDEAQLENHFRADRGRRVLVGGEFQPAR